MRWEAQRIDGTDQAALLPLKGLVRSIRTPDFDGVTFHEVLSKSALNRVPEQSAMPFSWTINPTRGCLHRCVYCLSPETLVLMADGRQKPIGDVLIGDRVIGTEFDGKYRRFVATEVQAAWRTVKQAHRVSLRDGTEIVASGDHRFLTVRGWKHVAPLPPGGGRRPFLTENDSLMGFGLGMAVEAYGAPTESTDYRRGYLAGMIRGDGMRIDKTYVRKSSGMPYRVTHFRLALADPEALLRSKDYLELEGVSTRLRPFTVRPPSRRAMDGIFTSKRADYAAIEQIVEWPCAPSGDWWKGFVAGIFDAEGSYSAGVLRISNCDDEILTHTASGLDALGIPNVRERASSNGVATVRVLGGRTVHRRFFHQVGPAITRKLGIVGRAVKSSSDLGVVAVENLGVEQEMVDITTGTGDFVANGVISHNCFARKTHEYLDLDSGQDFDTQIIVKTNVVDVLRKELARPSWKREHVALGTNSDPYMRAEGRYKLMPGIITALAESGTPFSILTKGPLLRRDLPLLQEAARTVPVSVAVSLAMVDPQLQQRVEPGTPNPKARLDLVRAITNAGLECTVLAMPILPWLTDSEEQLDALYAALADAGASDVTTGALHLRPGAREWFMDWLAREFPALVPQYRRLYGGGSYASKEYRQWLGERSGRLRRRHGFGKRPPRRWARDPTAEEPDAAPPAAAEPTQLSLF